MVVLQLGSLPAAAKDEPMQFTIHEHEAPANTAPTTAPTASPTTASTPAASTSTVTTPSASATTSDPAQRAPLQGSASTTPKHEYYKRIHELKDSWTSDAAECHVLWRVYMNAAEEAARKDDAKRALVLAESALEHSRHWKSTDPRTVQTLAFIAAECKKTGAPIDHEHLHKLVEPPATEPDYEIDHSIPTVAGENDSLDGLINEADVWVLDGQTEKAAQQFRKILAHLKARRSSDGADIVKVVDRLTRLYYREKHYVDAERIVRTALKDRGSMFDMMHEHDPERLQLGFLLADLGLTYSGTDRLIESEALYKAALDIMNRVLGPEHPDSVVTLGELARVHKYMQDYDSSEREYKQAISLAKGNPLISKISRGTIVGNYAKLLRKMGKNEKAALMEAHAAELSGKRVPSAH